MVIGFIICVITAVSLLVIGLSNDEEGFFPLGIVFCFIAEIAIVIGVYLFADIEEPPRAIDVYRGRTTLEITYRDSVAVDSVVIWKEE